MSRNEAFSLVSRVKHCFIARNMPSYANGTSMCFSRMYWLYLVTLFRSALREM